MKKTGSILLCILLLAGLLLPGMGTAEGKTAARSAAFAVRTKPVKKITLNTKEKTLQMKEGKTVSFTLKATIKPENATNPALTWTSDNTKVAKVSKKGKVTAVGEGTCKITAAARDGSGKKAVCKVMVKAPEQGDGVVKKITLTPEKVQLKGIGDGFVLKAEVDTTLKSTAYQMGCSLTNPDMVKFGTGNLKTGRTITALQEGSCEVSVWVVGHESVKATCVITIGEQKEDPIKDGIMLGSGRKTLHLGDSPFRLMVYKAAKYENDTVCYKVDKNSAIKVGFDSETEPEDTGIPTDILKITPLAEGKSVITVWFEEHPKVKATCEVTVLP